MAHREIRTSHRWGQPDQDAGLRAFGNRPMSPISASISSAVPGRAVRGGTAVRIRGHHLHVTRQQDLAALRVVEFGDLSLVRGSRLAADSGGEDPACLRHPGR